MPPWRGRGDLVISMTLAETFLLLVFMIWYSVRPKPNIPPTPPCCVENQDLKKRIAHLVEDLDAFKERVRILRVVLGLPEAASDEELVKTLPPRPLL